jgi:hypothetical protein
MVKNCLTFFRLRKAKQINATVAMAEEGAGAPTSGAAQAGGVQLAPAASSWDGVEYLRQGVIVTPGSEAQVSYMLNLRRLTDELSKPGNTVKVNTILADEQKRQEKQLAAGGGGGGGGHGHSHGGRPCHGHGGAGGGGGGGGGHGHSHGGGAHGHSH